MSEAIRLAVPGDGEGRVQESPWERAPLFQLAGSLSPKTVKFNL